jgi:Ca-activated chloride channel family protein
MMQSHLAAQKCGSRGRRSRALAGLAAMGIAGALLLRAQDASRPVYHVDVDMVVLTFRVMDSKGKDVSGLKAEDFRIAEDGIPQKIAVFGEGSRPMKSLAEGGGTSVFILFDTSDRMYETYPYVCDAVADFVRRLNPEDAFALYTFSRNLSRAAPLTHDRNQARAGLSNAVAGSDTALFNAILLTVRDAAKVPGRKAIVVFSNGPDNASMVSPYDVGRVAVNEGIPIYLISTGPEGRDMVTQKALESLTQETGGKLYWARSWQNQAAAFSSVREEIAASYTIGYYPAPNANEGLRNVQIQVIARDGKKYRVSARQGYEPRRTRGVTAEGDGLE